ncbi:hypothetical protein GJ496_011077, partial [Pomphorhynchus laevis]
MRIIKSLFADVSFNILSHIRRKRRYIPQLRLESNKFLYLLPTEQDPWNICHS